MSKTVVIANSLTPEVRSNRYKRDLLLKHLVFHHRYIYREQLKFVELSQTI